MKSIKRKCKHQKQSLRIIITSIFLILFFPIYGIAATDIKQAETSGGLQNTPPEKSGQGIEESFYYDSRGKRDPFISLLSRPGLYEYDDSAESPEGNLVTLYVELGGIVWDPVEPMALINDRVVREDEEYDSMKILKIDPRSVLIFYKDKEFRFALESDSENELN